MKRSRDTEEQIYRDLKLQGAGHQLQSCAASMA
jgi:hypothetical protein